ncbi:OmpP1/FadL family transporter [Thermophagus sp. OGC60D27]|uniref:OmpP1/FadL family transporter n=1 Tax=Thermophagus sp. OGC60D27 TaxID=3458415 RepID=UPI0040382F6E
MFNHKAIFSLFLFSLLTFSVAGQNEDNALSYSYQRPTGTARSMALGGAMGALGGDYSAIGINPAGIAVYRSSEFSFTPSLIYNNTESDYYGTSSSDDKFSFPINHISYVGTSRLMRETDGLVSTHFAIGYNRTNNYNRKSFIQHDGVASSLLYMFSANASGFTPQGLDNFYTGIAYDAFLLENLPGYSNEYIHAYEFVNDEGYVELGPVNGLNQKKMITEKGHSGVFDISFGANFGNKFYAGATVGIASITNTKESQHYEKADDEVYNEYIDYRRNNGFEILDDFYFNEYEKTTGTGINLKVGAIYKPINSLRLGAAFHTPTYYAMDMQYDTEAISYFFDADNYDIQSDLGKSSFNFRTPLKAIGSIAYIFGTQGLISFDYEYTDYSSMKYKSKNNDVREKAIMETLNETITNTFKATHNFRIGAEYRLAEFLALRGGYAYFQNPYKDDYQNSEGKHFNITGGLGFRAGNMTIDVAYLYNKETYIHSLYYSQEIPSDVQKPADMTSVDHQLALTLGWRF